jgi:hypothetical protein
MPDGLQPPFVLVIIRGGTDPNVHEDLVRWFQENFAVQFQGFESRIDKNLWAAFTGDFSALQEIAEKNDEIARTYPCIVNIMAAM